MIINDECAKVILPISLFIQTPSCVPNTCHVVKEQFMFFLCGQVLFPRDLMLCDRNSICMWLGMILSPGSSARMCLSKQVGNEVGWKISTVMPRRDINRFILFHSFKLLLKHFSFIQINCKIRKVSYYFTQQEKFQCLKSFFVYELFNIYFINPHWFIW